MTDLNRKQKFLLEENTKDIKWYMETYNCDAKQAIDDMGDEYAPPEWLVAALREKFDA
jgi:hypothetical protein